MTWLSGQVSYEDAAMILEQVGGIHLSDSTAWRSVQEWGERMIWVEGKQSENAQQKPVETTVAKSEKRLGAAMDGAIIYIRQEGWKELKVGSIFEIEPHTVLDERIGEDVEIGRAVKNSYVAHLGGPEPFGKKLFAEARRRNWLHVSETQVLGDAAAWIWNLADEYFGGSQQTVDWYHAKEHLYAACLSFHPEGTPAAQRWVNSHAELLYQGHAQRIAQALRKAAETQPGADQEAGYFENNHRRMNYMELREQGWLIGSGVIESAAKQFKARFAGPGMRWSRKGAERLLPIRAAVMGNQFDRIWSSVYNSPLN